MGNNVDLSQLAVDRSDSTGSSSAARPTRRWFSRYLLPLTLAVAFLGMLAWAARDSLLPAQSVTVIPVLVARAEVQQAGTPLFQAAGWVEPRPVPTVVSSLAEGVVKELYVVEGQRVAKGEPIARLLDVDARLLLRQVQAEQQIREADLAAAQAKLENAQIALRNPVQLRAALADAESSLSELEAEIEGLPSAIKAARTRGSLAQENLRSKESAGAAIAGRIVRQAKADLATAEATLTSLVVRQAKLAKQRQSLQKKQDALAESLNLKLDEKTRVSDAQSAVKSAQAQLVRAHVAVETARLELARTTITSPIQGRVLSIQAPPGKRVNGLDPYSEQGSSAIVNLYDPAMLQVRVDVRLEDVPHVQLGQKVQIETASVPEGLQGEVVSVTSLADIQKNTLSVKAAILDPPDVIRPEMLAQVTFLAPELPGAKKEESEQQQRLLIPRQLVIGAEGSASIWIADRITGTAIKRTVTLGKAGTDELVEAVGGLNPTDKLISSGREGLSDGQRIRVTAEDATLGSQSGPLVTARSPTTTQTK